MSRLHKLAVVQLRQEAGCCIDAGRVYVARAPRLEELGLSTRGLPAALLRWVVAQLRIGTTSHDLLFVCGRAWFRKVVQFLEELHQHSLLDERTLTLDSSGEYGPFSHCYGTDGLPDAMTLPAGCPLLIQSGSLSTLALPASLARCAQPQLSVLAIGVAGGHVLLARRRGAEPCLACLALWFMGSRALPLSFIQASLEAPPAEVGNAVDDDRLASAIARATKLGCGILFFPAGARTEVLADTPPGRHPACSCGQAQVAARSAGADRHCGAARQAACAATSIEAHARRIDT